MPNRQQDIKLKPSMSTLIEAKLWHIIWCTVISSVPNYCNFADAIFNGIFMNEQFRISKWAMGVWCGRQYYICNTINPLWMSAHSKSREKYIWLICKLHNITCSVSGHFLTQCWLIVNWTLRNKQWNSNGLVQKRHQIMAQIKCPSFWRRHFQVTFIERQLLCFWLTPEWS